MEQLAAKPFTLDFLYRVFDLAPIGIVITDPQGEIEDVNQYICSITDYQRDELVGQQVELLVPERFRGQHEQHRQGFTRNPGHRMMGQNRELFCVTKSGAELPIEVGLAPIREAGALKVVATITDVTIKRDAERKMRALYSELEEVSTPVLEVWEQIAVVPIIGSLDSNRAQKLMENSLVRMKESRYRITILDITGLTGIDTSIANHLLQLASAVRLMGGKAVITGISPEIARTIVRLGVNLGELRTSATLSSGLQYALSLLRDA